MKKTILAVLAAIAMFSQTAFAYDMNVEMNWFTFHVSQQSGVDAERPTIQMLDKTKTKVLYTGEGTSGKNADDTYTFTFEQFNVPETLATGTYIIRIGGRGLQPVEKEVNFINMYDLGKGLNLLEQTPADEIGGVLDENAAGLGIDVTAYRGLAPQWQEIINNAVVREDLANDGSAAQIEAAYSRFMNAYAGKLELAVIAGSKNTAMVSAMIQNASYLQLDIETWYGKLPNPVWVADILAATDFQTSVTEEQVVKAYNGAVLTGVINQLDWGEGKSALRYYHGLDVTTVDVARAEALSQTNQANVFKGLKNAGIKDYAKLPAKYDELLKQYSGSDGGGSSGGGGGSSSVVIPAKPEQTPQPTEKPDAQAPAFQDLGGVEWAREAIESLAAQGVLSGDGAGNYNPQRDVTREEFAKIMVSAFSLYDESAECLFTDVPEGTWYYPYVASARKNGVISGVSETEFGTGQQITRQDMAVMMKRVYDMAGITPEGSEAEYIDAEEIAGYARDAVAVLSAVKILSGTGGGAFSPRQSVTRAQSAKAVYELQKMIGG